MQIRSRKTLKGTVRFQETIPKICPWLLRQQSLIAIADATIAMKKNHEKSVKLRSIQKHLSTWTANEVYIV